MHAGAGDDEPGALSGETQESSDAGASAALTTPEKGKVAASLTAKLRHQRPLLWPHPCDDQTHFRLRSSTLRSQYPQYATWYAQQPLLRLAS